MIGVSECWEVRSMSSLRSIALGSGSNTSTTASTSKAQSTAAANKKSVILPKPHFIELWTLMQDIIQSQDLHPLNQELYDSVVTAGK